MARRSALAPTLHPAPNLTRPLQPSADILLWIQAGFAFVIASYPVYRFLSTIGVYTFLASLNVLARRLLGIRHHVFGDRIRRSTSVMLSNHP